MKGKGSRFIYYVLGGFATALFVTFIILYHFTVFANYGYNITTVAISLSGSIVIIGLVLVFVIFAYNRSISYYNHLRENEQIFGEKISIPNFDMFVQKVTKFRAKKVQEETYICSFSPIKENISYESFQSDQIKLLNGKLANYLKTLFEDKKYNKSNVAHCYYSHSFVFYLKTTKEDLDVLLSDIESRVYLIAKEYDVRLFVQAFFGVVKVEEDVTTFDLVTNAINARRIGENNFENIVYFSEKSTKLREENDVNRIIDALRKKEFIVYYQPKFSLSKKRFVGCEALIRWNTKENGIISPVRFINFAENSGIIHEIDMYVLETVCQDIRDWSRRGRRIEPVSINFSLYEFYSPSFINDVIGVIKDYDIDPSLIEIEITEETSPATSFLVISILKKLKEFGLRILLDDFGIGFSNINNVKKLPIDTIKLDKSLIDDIAVDKKAKEICRTMVNLGKSLGIEVLAEGVGEQSQVDVLKGCRCDTIQGFYYSRPIPKKEYEAFLLSNKFEKKGVVGY